MDGSASTGERRRREALGRRKRVEAIAVLPVAAAYAPPTDLGLAAAASRVETAWRAPGVRGDGTADPWPWLHTLADALDRGCTDFAGAAAPGDARGTARDLLHRLRAEAVRAWSAAVVPPPASRMLAALTALEDAAGALEPTPEERLAARLGDPAGKAMVREVAHDLQSPLTSILFLSETLRRGHSGPVNTHQQQQLGIIYRASLGLMSLANGFLELLGGDAPVSGEAAPFAVEDLLEQVCDLARPVADEKGLALHLRCPAGRIRLGHPQEISRVLVNLATNALKFTEQGFLEIAAEEIGGDVLEFSVRDTGPGLPDSALGSLYEPFRPGQPGRHFTFSGSGLGLAICRRLVEGMGSTLRLETADGWGTRFYFRLHLPPVASGTDASGVADS
jgi:signal transduction histidine kinase